MFRIRSERILIDIEAAQVIYRRNTQNPRYTWDAATLPLTPLSQDASNAIRGTSVIDRINGNAGNDRLFGLTGGDVPYGGDGTKSSRAARTATISSAAAGPIASLR